VHRNKFLFNNQPDALIIQIYSVIKLYRMSGVRMELQFHPESAWKHKFTNAECTVENSWWWAEKIPETCRVL